MVRQLPWKSDGATANKRLTAGGTTIKVNCPSSAPPHRPSAADRSTPTRPGPNLRSPSTSPARAEPPKDEFMIEGVDHDDRYRMVEDEFLSVAGQFTKHLHAAEYQRLKSLAKSQNAETIHNISRPVIGEMIDLVRRRHAALDTAAKQRKGIARYAKKRAASSTVNSETGDDDDLLPRQPTSYLQGLMDSPRKRAVPLTSFSSMIRSSSFREPVMSTTTTTTTTTATTIKREVPPEPSSDSDSDDLDGQPPWRSMRKDSCQGIAQTHRLSSQSTPAVAASSQEPIVRIRPLSEVSRIMKQAPVDHDGDDPFAALRTRTVEKQQTGSASHPVFINDDEDDDPFARSRARKRAREAKAQQQQKHFNNH